MAQYNFEIVWDDLGYFTTDNFAAKALTSVNGRSSTYKIDVQNTMVVVLSEEVSGNMAPVLDSNDGWDFGCTGLRIISNSQKVEVPKI